MVKSIGLLEIHGEAIGVRVAISALLEELTTSELKEIVLGLPQKIPGLRI